MKKSRSSKEQIIGIPKEQEAGMTVAALCRKHGMSDASFYTWKAKYGGLDVSETKRLLAEAVLDNVALKDLLGKKVVTPAARREATAYLQATYDMSERQSASTEAGCVNKHRGRRTASSVSG